MKKLRKVVFPVTGFGTRFLPATKAMPKELIPTVDKPFIQYAAEEAIDGLIEKPDASEAPLKLASLGRYVLTPDIFDTLRVLSLEPGGEIQLAGAINIQAQEGSVETVRLNGRRFDSGSADGFMKACQHEYEKRLVV